MVGIDAADGSVTPLRWDDAGTPAALQVACVRNADGWRCKRRGAGARACRPRAPARSRRRSSSSSRPRLGTDAVRVVSTGCTRAGSGANICVASADAGHEATSRLEAAWALLPALRALPTAALTVRGDVDVGAASLGVHNVDGGAGALALHAGGRVVAPALRISAPPGASVAASLASADTALRALLADRFFARYFGMGAAAWAERPGARRVACASDCAAAILEAIGAGARLLVIDGDARVAGRTAFGSAEDPVALVASGLLRLSGEIAVHGVVHAASLEWNYVGAGGALVRGATLVGNDDPGHGRGRLRPRDAGRARSPRRGERWLRAGQRQLEGLLTMPSARSSHLASRRQRGISIVESLVAFVVVAAGNTAAAAQLQSRLHLAGDIARERSEAVRIGADAIEEMRSFVALDGSAAERTYAAIASGDSSIDASSTSSASSASSPRGSYRIERRIDDAGFAATKSARVNVRWNDRSGSAHDVVLDSFIAAVAPAYSGSLALGVGSIGAAARVCSTQRRVPLTARNLGDGRSAWKPVEGGPTALIFDNRSGAVVGRCDGIATTMATRDISSAASATCMTGRWLLVAGTIRFSSTAPPNPLGGSDAPLPTASRSRCATAPIRHRRRASAKRGRPCARWSTAACRSSTSRSARAPAPRARPTVAIASSPGIASSRPAPTVAGRGGSSSSQTAGGSAAAARRAASVATSAAPARSMRTSRLAVTTSMSPPP